MEGGGRWRLVCEGAYKGMMDVRNVLERCVGVVEIKFFVTGEMTSFGVYLKINITCKFKGAQAYPK